MAKVMAVVTLALPSTAEEPVTSPLKATVREVPHDAVVMLALPLKLVPLIFRAVSRIVAVAELPVHEAAVVAFVALTAFVAFTAFVALTAFVAFVTAVEPICATMSAAEAIDRALDPLPRKRPPLVNAMDPVPPLATAKDVMPVIEPPVIATAPALCVAIVPRPRFVRADEALAKSDRLFARKA